MKKTPKIFIVLFFAITLTAFTRADAQSSVWNAPSTDVQPAGTVYVEAGYFARFKRAEDGGFRSYSGRVLYGARKNFEIGFNAFYTRSGETAQPIEIQPNLKFNFYENEKHGVKISAGAIAYLPITRPRESEAVAAGMIYSTISKKFGGNFGPRLTTGGYALAGRQMTNDRTGFLAAYEQPVNTRVSFVADWLTGKNRFGYAGGGLALTMTKKSFLYAGYNVGNSGRGNNYFSAFYGYTF